ncbi:MAG: tyrosine-type recombinase/integrase [Sphingomonas oligoaromativorans]
MGVALTKLGIEAAMAKVQKGGRIELIDEREAGLRIRVGERVAKWSTMVRTPTGGRIRIPLGAWPALGIADARKAAQDAKRKVEQGINPNEEKREAARLAEIAKRTRRSLRDVLDDYSAVKLKHLRRGDAVKRALDGKKGLLRDMLDREPGSITRTDIADAVRKQARTSPIAANRALAYANAFFNWCVSEELIEANPAGKVKKPGKENQRDRYHTLDELAEIWAAADTLGYPFGPLYRLLIALPMRREEIAAIPVR